MTNRFRFPKPNRELERRRKQRLRSINRRIIREEKARRGCELCGRMDLPPRLLHFHHRDPATKRRKISHMITSRTVMLVDELTQCRLWCQWSHNRYHHTGRIEFCPGAFAARNPEKEVASAR